MLTVSSKVLSLSAEAALLVQGGRIVYANASAEAILGSDCVGRPVKELFGREIVEAQAGVFTADAEIGGKRRNIRTARLDDMQAFFISEIDIAPVLVNDAFLYSVRSALMNLHLSTDLGRARAEQLGDPALDSALRSLQRDILRISRLLDNAAVVRAIAAGELAVSLEPMSLSSLCRKVIETMSLLRGDVRFSFYCGDEISLFADRVLIEQLLYNLISNALVHGAPLTQVTVSLVLCSTQVILSVSDDGRGIDEEMMGHVFERYSSGFALSDLDRGAGLGFSVVRGIAQAHGGTLMLECRRSGGVSARVSLAYRSIPATLKAPREETPDQRRLLTGMSVCLPPELYDARFLD